MITYIIDAYNVIHKTPGLRNSNFPKRDFLNFIRENRLTGNISNRAIIVFDGHPTNEPYSSGSFDVTFSYNNSADNIIKEKIAIVDKKHPVIVVTNDREIIRYAKMEGVRTCSVSEFIGINKGKDESEKRELSDHAKSAITKEMEKYFLDKKN